MVTSRKATAWGVSTLFHVGALWALMQTPGITIGQRPRLNGRPTAIVLQATMTPQTPSDAPETEKYLDVDVTVGPERVEIARRELLPIVDDAGPTLLEPLEVSTPKPRMPVAQPARHERSTVNEETPAEAPAKTPPRDHVPAGGIVSPEAIGVEPSSLPSPVFNPPPIYPPRARAENIEGLVLLSLRIGIDGRVKFLEVANSSGHAILDAAAIRAVRGWRFEPARREGQPASWSGKLPVRFTLE